jgi:hypothetical protein
MQANWEQASDDLGLELVIPFDLDLGTGVIIHAELLVKNFGGRNGTMIVKKYGAVKNNLEQIQKLGFGFSVLDEPRDPYDRATMIEMLRDWEWTGPRSQAPKWMIPSE